VLPFVTSFVLKLDAVFDWKPVEAPKSLCLVCSVLTTGGKLASLFTWLAIICNDDCVIGLVRMGRCAVPTLSDSLVSSDLPGSGGSGEELVPRAVDP
jgi:hypothetical protein